MGRRLQNIAYNCAISSLLDSRVLRAILCHSAHTCLIERVLIEAFLIVTGCLRPILTDHRPYFPSQPAKLRRLGAALLSWLTVALYGPWPYTAWSFKWALGFPPIKTKIQTPVCASCAETTKQPRRNRRPHFFNGQIIDVTPNTLRLSPKFLFS